MLRIDQEELLPLSRPFEVQRWGGCSICLQDCVDEAIGQCHDLSRVAGNGCIVNFKNNSFSKLNECGDIAHRLCHVSRVNRIW